VIEGKRLLYVTARTLARYLAAPWYSRLYGVIAFCQWNIRRTSTHRLPAQVRRAYFSHRHEFTTKNDVSHRGEENIFLPIKLSKLSYPIDTV